MKRILTTVAAALIAGQAGAATLTPLSGFGDSDFVALCGEGGNNEACERGVAEIRGGNGRPNGDLEFTVREGFDGFRGPSGQLAISAGSAFAFDIAFDGASAFSLRIGQTTLTEVVDFSGVDALLLRTSNSDGSFSLTDLVLDGMALGGPIDANRGYASITDFDFTRAFSLTGVANFANDIVTARNGRNNGSRLAAQFKFVDLGPSPVPLPAAGWLMVAGLGGLVAMRRRKG